LQAPGSSPRSSEGRAPRVRLGIGAVHQAFASLQRLSRFHPKGEGGTAPQWGGSPCRFMPGQSSGPPGHDDWGAAPASLALEAAPLHDRPAPRDEEPAWPDPRSP